jgi:TonB family protein
MKKLNLGYFAGLTFIIMGISAASLIGSEKLTVTDRDVVNNEMKITAGIDSVIVDNTNARTGYLLTLLKSVDNNDFATMFGEKIKYPGKALEYNIEGVVKVKFTVEANGNVSNVEIIESPDPVLSAEVINAVKRVKLQPIIQNGYSARYTLVLPVSFNLIK